MDVKSPEDLIYVLGVTKDELGGSEYYDHLGYVGKNVPQVDSMAFAGLYKALSEAIREGSVASVHGIYAGGLGVHLALMAIAGGLGISVDLARGPANDVARDDKLLFSESAGRFLVTIDAARQSDFEKRLNNLPYAQIGKVQEQLSLSIQGLTGASILTISLDELKTAWQQPFGELQ